MGMPICGNEQWLVMWRKNGKRHHRGKNGNRGTHCKRKEEVLRGKKSNLPREEAFRLGTEKKDSGYDVTLKRTFPKPQTA